MTPAGAGEAELLYRDCDFGAGVTEVTVEVAGEGVVEVVLDGGDKATVLTPAATAGPYDYTTVRAALTTDGVRDVRLRLRGPLRLAHVGFSG